MKALVRSTTLGAVVAAAVTAVAVACGGGDDSGAANDASAPDGSRDATTFDAPQGDVADAGRAPDAAPPTLANAVLWLVASEGTTLDGGAVTAWADQSGQHNDGVAGKFAPTMSAADIGGRPAIHFVAGQRNMFVIADSTSLQWGAGPYLVEAVGRFDNDPTQGISIGAGPFYVKLGPNSLVALYANYQTITDAGGYGPVVAGLWSQESYDTYVGVEAAYNDSMPRLYAVQYDAGVLTLRVNGSVVATSTGGVDVSEPGQKASVGGSYYGSGNLDGDIAELVAVKGAISSSDLADLEGYLMAKYGL